jgi:hypothetical protein
MQIGAPGPKIKTPTKKMRKGEKNPKEERDAKPEMRRGQESLGGRKG